MANDGTNFLADYSKFLESRSEHLTYAALSIYRNFPDDLSKKEEQFLKEHLSSCKICSLRLKELTEFERNGNQKSTKTIFGLKASTFRYAIAALLVVSVGSVILTYIFNSPQKKLTSQSSPSQQSLIAESADLERFARNRILENFIGRTVRSLSTISLRAPRIGDTLTIPFTFKWEGLEQGDISTLTVVDNKNVEVWKITTSSAETLLEKTLEPGLYYVKLEVNEKLVRVGKFIVVR